MIIQICIGSACHIKGSYEVIEVFKQLVMKHELNEIIELKSSFCLGACGQGVSVKVDDEIISVLPETAERIFTDKVLKVVAL